MQTGRESVCCRDIEQTNFKLDVFNEEGHDIECITDHPGFGTVCRDRYVPETAYYQYRQQYGVPQQEDNEQQICGILTVCQMVLGIFGKRVNPQDDVDMKDLLRVDSTTTLPFFRAGVEARTGAVNGEARRCGAGGTSGQAEPLEDTD
ncbi:hypothetical protein MAR_038155 [Mya arenaria]|uniref:Uncharacterized protein n=1 Tax=Mya arenaria TaxID=6604 RepID=A0ABY7FUT1_MYAAR|nr:hypothetical protein MAR_038155 [Mya arenaria]